MKDKLIGEGHETCDDSSLCETLNYLESDDEYYCPTDVSGNPSGDISAVSSFNHRSEGTENFYKNCTAKRLSGPLFAKFHLCRVESNKSTRKLSLRTRNTSSSLSTYDSASSSPLEDHCGFPGSPTNNPNIDVSGGGLNALHLDEIIWTSATSEERLDMGCGSSSVNQLENNSKPANTSFEDDDDSDEKNQSDRSKIDDIGMTSISKADLLDVQRLHATDVTRGLEDRWIRSHFSDQVASKSDTRAKRRKISCRRSDTSTPDTSPLNTPDQIQSANQQSVTVDTEVSPVTPEFQQAKDHLCILHFNDVYEISERKKDPIGGAARFSALVKSQIARAVENTGERPLVIFSGDCLNPSTLSCATQGIHMIEVLNNLDVDVAVFGNHEFDFGVEHAAKCIKQMKSTWLLGNVIDKLTLRNLADGESKLMIQRKSGLKIGLVGLVEEEWLDTLATVDKSDLDYQDYVKLGRQLAKELREEGAEFVIALTHMRWPNDVRLAREVPDIDMILGGHDHEYGVKEIDECLIVKSGSDFRNFSGIDVYLRHDGCVDVKLTRHDVTKNVPEDKIMLQIVTQYTNTLEKSLERQIGQVKANLNGRFKMIRSRETTLGNFVADIMASVTRADIVLINSGTFRSDAVHSSGDFRLHDLMTILPINDTVVTIVATGQQLLDALENGVSKVPKLEGRFPQVSGICFGFNPGAKSGHRVIRETIRIHGKPLDLNASYRVATKAYVARGKDGYTCLSKCDIMNDPDSGPLLSTVVRNHIMNVQRLLEFEKNMSCKISVSSDGRSISCDKPDIDANQAFYDVDTEAPIDTIQKSMKPVMDRNSNCIHRFTNSASNDVSKMLHVPNFIAPVADDDYASSEEDAVISEKIARLRKAAISSYPNNVKLLYERSQSRHDVRWQICPLLEARIFHCKSIDG